MNHELFSAMFRYALKHEISFQMYCNASIWLSCRPNQTCMNPGRHAEGVGASF